MAEQNNRKNVPGSNFLHAVNNNLDQMENNLQGSDAQIVQANHDVRHFYAQLLRNPNISHLKLVTDASYQRLSKIIYDTEPIEPIASVKGMVEGTGHSALGMATGIFNTVRDPAGTLNNIAQTIENAIDNPAQAFQDFTLGSMAERAKLADIMEIDDAAARVQAHHAFYTEFVASRSLALTSSIAGGKFIAQASRSGLNALTAAGKDTLPPTGLSPAFADGPQQVAAISISTKTSALQDANVPGAVAMSMQHGHSPRDTKPVTNQTEPSVDMPLLSPKQQAAAQLATEEYIVAGRLEIQLNRILASDQISAESRFIAVTLRNLVRDQSKESRTDMVNMSAIPDGKIGEFMIEKDRLILSPNVAVSNIAEQRVIHKILTQANAKADLLEEFREIIGKNEFANAINIQAAQTDLASAFSDALEGGLRLQLSRIRVYDSTPRITPPLAADTTSAVYTFLEGPSP